MPVYHTAGTRGAGRRPPIYRGRLRLLAIISLVVLIATVFLLTVNFTLAQPATAAPDRPVPTHGPFIDDLLAGPLPASIASTYDAFRPRGYGLATAPAVSAGVYILVDLDSGETLASLDPHARVAVASLTKIVTAMTALRLASAGDQLIVGVEDALAPPNRMGILPGEVLTVEDLLYGLLLDSGNDAAATLAANLGGEEAFVQAMNTLAAEIGLINSRFTNPAGFDDAGSHSTAYDMAVLARRLLDTEPLLARIVGTERQIIESSPAHGWFGPTNLNRLLTDYPGALGVKTGRTDSAGYTLIAAAERDGRRLLVVVLGSEHHFDDAEILLDFGFAMAGPGPVG
ncbi:MAG: D-alanyl-D-alanine carboxypeptidase family protein [Chloroflexota bacterium]|nr:D-alanyl-D-alanine carboxypeptidase family protein [Chloroflexota bacterium]